jgi:hypothetical protein
VSATAWALLEWNSMVVAVDHSRDGDRGGTRGQEGCRTAALHRHRAPHAGARRGAALQPSPEAQGRARRGRGGRRSPRLLGAVRPRCPTVVPCTMYEGTAVHVRVEMYRGFSYLHNVFKATQGIFGS